MRSNPKAEKISRIFVRLRTLVGASQAQLVERSAGAIGRHELGKVERGKSLMSTEAKRKAVAAAYGIDVEHVRALVDEKITPEEVARLVPPFASEKAHEVGSAKRRGRPPGTRAKPLTPKEQGETMATFVRLHHATKSRFPNLELCLLYHEMNGKKWRDSSVTIARSGDAGAVDRRPEEWAALLDQLDGLVASVLRRIEPSTP